MLRKKFWVVRGGPGGLLGASGGGPGGLLGGPGALRGTGGVLGGFWEGPGKVLGSISGGPKANGTVSFDLAVSLDGCPWGPGVSW